MKTLEQVNLMTDEQKRVRIAELCGWRTSTFPEGLWENDSYMGAVYDDGLPDYLHDLNACHEMEKVMDGGKLFQYALTFQDVGFGGSGTWRAFMATASQRATAFLMVMDGEEGK